MNNTQDIDGSALAPVTGSAKLTVRVTMRILEYHTFEREVEAGEFRAQQKTGDPASWLEDKFRDDPMPDSDIETGYVELEEWAVISPNDGSSPTGSGSAAPTKQAL